MPNAFQRGEQFAVDQETKDLANQASARKEKGINALAGVFGEGALAPQEFVQLNANARGDRIEARNAEKDATEAAYTREDREMAKADRDRQRMLSAASGAVAALDNAIKTGSDITSALTRVSPTLAALRFEQEDIAGLGQILTEDPSQIDNIKALVTSLRSGSGTGTDRRRVVKSENFRGSNGEIYQRITRADGTTDNLKLDGTPLDAALAQERNDLAASRMDAEQIALRKAAEAGSKKAGERLDTGLDLARKAEVSVKNGQELIALMDEGIKSGSFAKARLGTSRFFSDILGLKPDPEVANTDEYLGRVGLAVAAQITSFGAGTGLSDADREFAAGIVGGNIAMDEKALRRLVEMRLMVDKKAIQDYNADREAVAGGNANLAKQYPSISVPGADETDAELEAILNKYATPGAE